MRRAILAAAVAVVGLAGCETVGDGDALVQAAPVCVHTTIPVYFGESEAGLTEPAREMITTAAQALRGCSIERVRVIGLASATGASDTNMTLSQQRAIRVAEVLVDAGLPAPAFELIAAGDEGAVSDGVAEPVRRRVEVIVEAAPAR